MNSAGVACSRPGLCEIVASELERTPSAAASALTEKILNRHQGCCRAVLYYGSGLRCGDEGDVILDLLVIVDHYHGFYSKRSYALGNTLLPPNVFYLETALGERTLRAKYAVVSAAHFARGTSPRTLEVYWWGRFAQPCLLVHARDSSSRAQVIRAVAQAVATLVAHSIPLTKARFRAPELWRAGLAACYGTELRAERAGNADHLVEFSGERCERVTRAAIADCSRLCVPTGDVRILDEETGTCFQSDMAASQRRWNRFVWSIRRVHGKGLHLMRLVKGAFTFEGGVDYLLWKIERHSGVRVEPSPRARRHPLLFGWKTLFELRRRGAFH